MSSAWTRIKGRNYGLTNINVHRGGRDFCALYRHRRLGARRFHARLLRGGQRYSPGPERYGNRRRLDVRRVFYFHGGADRAELRRLRRLGVSYGLDRRLCDSRHVAGALSAQIREIHGPGVYRRSLLLQFGASGCRGVPHYLLGDLRYRPDERRGRGVFTVSGSGLRHRPLRRYDHRVCLRGARRYEGHYLHADCAVLRADSRLHDTGDFYQFAAYRQPAAAAGFGQHAARHGCLPSGPPRSGRDRTGI